MYIKLVILLKKYVQSKDLKSETVNLTFILLIYAF